MTDRFWPDAAYHYFRLNVSSQYKTDINYNIDILLPTQSGHTKVIKIWGTYKRMDYRKEANIYAKERKQT